MMNVCCFGRNLFTASSPLPTVQLPAKKYDQFYISILWVWKHVHVFYYECHFFSVIDFLIGGSKCYLMPNLRVSNRSLLWNAGKLIFGIFCQMK